MADEKNANVPDHVLAGERAKAEGKAPPLQYPESRALAKPKKAAPPAGGGGGGGGGRPDPSIEEAVKTLLADRDEWYLVVEGVPNAGKFYDGFRAQGAEVRVAKTGQTVELTDAAGNRKSVMTYNVWARIPRGEVRPVRKGKGKTNSAGETTHPPTQSRPPAGTVHRIK